MQPKTCIYCGERLGPDTRRAHVIPAALGGRLADRDFCCDVCNNEISAVERSLCKVLQPLTAMIGVRRGDKRRSPSLQVHDPDQGRVSVWGGHPKTIGMFPRVAKRD